MHNGRDVWTYTSDTNTVSHTVLPAHARTRDVVDPTPRRADPGRGDRAGAQGDLADAPSVTLGPTRTVAGPAGLHAGDLARATHARRSARSRSRSTAHTSSRCRSQVFGASSTPAIKVGFTEISFATPAASTFNFHAPAGATVTKNPFTGGPSSHDGEPAVQARCTARPAAPHSAARHRLRDGRRCSRSTAPTQLGRDVRADAQQLTTPVGTSGHAAAAHRAGQRGARCRRAGVRRRGAARGARAHRRDHRAERR